MMRAGGGASDAMSLRPRVVEHKHDDSAAAHPTRAERNDARDAARERESAAAAANAARAATEAAKLAAEAVAAELAARERAGPSLREHPAKLQDLVSGLAAATKLPAPRPALARGVGRARGGCTQAADRRATISALGGAASALGGSPAGLLGSAEAADALAAAEPSAAARAAKTANDRKSALRRQAEEKVKEADALVGCRAAPLRYNSYRPSSPCTSETFRGAVGTGDGIRSHRGCCPSPCAFYERSCAGVCQSSGIGWQWHNVPRPTVRCVLSFVLTCLGGAWWAGGQGAAAR
jgi:hypothetical protein